VVLVVIAVGIFIATFDANQYRGGVLERLSGSLNRPVEASELKLQIFPLRLRLEQVRVKEDPAFAPDDFLRAAAVQFDVNLGALLFGEVQVTAIELVEPTIHLHQDDAGRWNVATLGAAPSEGAPPPQSGAPGPPPIEDWRIEKGTIVFERPGERPLQLTGVELALSDLSTTAPFAFALAVNFSPESRVAAEGILGPIDFEAIERSRLEAEATLENVQPAALRGLFAVPPRLAALGAISGKFDVSSKPNEIRLGGTATLGGREAGDELGLQLAVTFPPDLSGLDWRDTRLSYRGAQVATSGSAVLAPDVHFDFKVSTSDAELAALAAIAPRLGVPLPVKVPGTGKLTSDLTVKGTPESWELAGQARLREMSVPLEGLSQPARIASVDLTLEPERMVAAPFSVALDRNLSLTVAGEVREYRTEPLAQLRVSGGEVPVEALLALAAQFGAKPLEEGQKLAGFVEPAVELGGPLSEPAKMHYSGTLKFRNLSLTLPKLARPLTTPALALEFNPQRLSAAPFALVLGPGVQLTVTGSVEDYRGAGRLAARITGEEIPLEPLLGLMAQLGKSPLGKGQKLTGRVRPAIELTGSLSELEKLGYRGTLALREASFLMPPLPEPVRIAAAEVALAPARLSAENVPVQLGERLRARVNFRLENYQTEPRLVARVVPEATELEALLAFVRALGSDPLPGGRGSGQIAATIDVTGALGEKAPPLDISGRAQLSGARVQPATLREPLVIDQAALEFTPARLEVTSFRLAAAGSRVSGSLRVENFDSPAVRFDFRGDTLDVDALKAFFGAQPPAAAPQQPQRRSSLFSLPVVLAQSQTRGGTDWFARLSGRGRVEFERVRNGTFTLVPFSSNVAIANQVITCNPIDFGLYEGGGRGRLVVDLRGAEPASDFSALLRNVDANELLSENSKSKNTLYGRMGGTVEARFLGSEWARVKESARGKGQLTLVNGRLAQINLGRELVLLGKLAGLRYEGRDTPIEDMTTNFEIANGWVRTNDLTMRTPDMTVTAVGGFSLDDELAFEGTAVFTEEASRRLLPSSTGPLGQLGGLLGTVVGVVFVDDQGRIVVPFLLRGTFSKPQPLPDHKRLPEMKTKGAPVRRDDPLGDILRRIPKRPQ
jgi:uncharacterized protein involved in outer membrane biogenesis